MKYIARVTEVLEPRIHKVGTIRDGKPVAVADMPLPDKIEIHLDREPSQPCMIYRYTDSGVFCGNTWHQNLEDAFAAAEEEYGLSAKEFTLVKDDGPIN
jgi:hypothetical protein